MPRHTHPGPRRHRHTRAHVREQRDRWIGRRQRRLAREQMLRELHAERVWRGRDAGPPAAPPLIDELAEDLRGRPTSWHVAPGGVPHRGGLSQRLLDGVGACGDYYDCACGHCLSDAHPSRRARAKRQTTELIDEQLRDTDPYRHAPYRRDCARHDWVLASRPRERPWHRVTARCRRCQRRKGMYARQVPGGVVDHTADAHGQP